MPGLSFLNPILLWGAVAASLPLLLHLLRRQRYQELWFSGLIFLSPSLKRQLRSSRLTHLLLLLLRMALILCLSLALAGPELGGWRLSSTATSWAIVLDQSASMAASKGGITVFEKARTEALKLLENLGPRDRLTLIGSAALPLVYMVETPGGQEKASSLLRQLEPASTGGNLERAAQEASSILAHSDIPERQLVVFTDGQEPLSSLPASSSRLITLGYPSIANLRVSELRTPRLLGDRSLRRFQLSIQNSGTAKTQGIARINIDGAYLGEKAVELEPQASLDISFEVSLLKEVKTGFIELSGDDFTPDNRHFFIVGHEEKIPVLLVGPSQERLYLQAALEASEESSPSQFTLFFADVLPDSLDPSIKVVLLCGLPSFTSREKQILEAYQQGGVSMLLFLGSETAPSLVNETLSATELFPFRLTGRQEGSWALQTASPRIEHLPEPATLDALLQEVSMNQRHTLMPLGAMGQTWLSFADQQPFWVEFQALKSKVLLVLAPPTREAGSFVVSPYFVLLLRKSVFYLAQGSDRQFLQVGDSFPTEEGWRWLEPKTRLTTPTLEQPGLLAQYAAETGALIRSQAVRLPQQESVFQAHPQKNQALASQTATDLEENTSLVFPLLVLAGLLFVLENILTAILTKREASSV